MTRMVASERGTLTSMFESEGDELCVRASVYPVTLAPLLCYFVREFRYFLDFNPHAQAAFKLAHSDLLWFGICANCFINDTR